GPVSAGKTTLASRLRDRFGAIHLKTSVLLEELAEGRVPLERGAMQRFGARLDSQTGGRWVAEDLVPRITDLPEDAVVVIDAARIGGQIDALRAALPPQRVHVHPTAPPAAPQRRYRKRPKTRSTQRA